MSQPEVEELVCRIELNVDLRLGPVAADNEEERRRREEEIINTIFQLGYSLSSPNRATTLRMARKLAEEGQEAENLPLDYLLARSIYLEFGPMGKNYLPQMEEPKCEMVGWIKRTNVRIDHLI